MKMKFCKVCLVEHDQEIHDATVRLRQWMKERVLHSIAEPQIPEMPDAA